MKSWLRVLFVLATATGVAAGASRAFAQGTGPSARQNLGMTLSVAEGLDSDAPADARTAGAGALLDSAGFSTTLTGGVDYLRQTGSVQFRASGMSSLRRYQPLEDVLYSLTRNVSHSAAIGLSAPLPGRTTMVVNQTATYSPSYLFNLFPLPVPATPGEALPVAPDYALSNSASSSYGTMVGLSHNFRRRSSVSATADYQLTDMSVGPAGRRALNSYAVRSELTHRVTRNTTVTGGYRYRFGDVALNGGGTSAGSLVDQGVDIGLDYRRQLSASRQMTLGARVGSSTVLSPDLTEGSGAGDSRYRILSSQLMIGYAFARNWQARATYRRGIDYVAGITVPVFANSVTTSADGLLTRRLKVSVSAGYSSGAAALSRAGSTFGTYTGNVKLGYAATRSLAAYGEYLYYFYDSGGTVPLEPGIPSGLERRGIRVGLTLRMRGL